MYPYIGMSVIALLNFYFAYYYIIGAGRGELTFMGYVSLLVGLVFLLLLYRYHQSVKRQNMKDFNSHIKSDDDRLIK
ncbi:hypothetical protein [Macrococcus equipercicus]|uniref:Uncharacterized protein n=1 Tax=Macrococcus equipercicus TaxID=69967 RepID=A0A9Q9F1P0_9STAP|nr:hypothetical protein [Macrococcus equipercicus]KAA1037644.1 hypothetical protein ERX35_009715 [Macrococcus equipercicus]UTH14157.1 hypothetical protein KFV11_01935 [Macrococcus equipercicus]